MGYMFTAVTSKSSLLSQERTSSPSGVTGEFSVLNLQSVKGLGVTGQEATQPKRSNSKTSVKNDF